MNFLDLRLLVGADGTFVPTNIPPNGGLVVDVDESHGIKSVNKWVFPKIGGPPNHPF